MNIIAQILHHNSPESLRKVIFAIKQQSVNVTSIVVVDNGSTNDIRALFSDLGESIEYLLIPNLGVGAGHNTGFQYIIQKYNPDFIWLLEHDVIPDSNCLEGLLQEAKKGDFAIFYPGERDELEYNRFRIYECNMSGIKRLINKTELPNYRGGLSFNGCLIPQKVIHEIGLLNEDYFIGREDIDYYKRLYAKGGYVLRVNSVRVKHDLHKNKKIIRFGKWQFLLPNESLIREYYSFRNDTFDYIKEGHSPISISIKHFLSLFFVLFFKNHKWKRLRNRNQAFIHAMSGKLGRCDTIHI